MHESPVEAVRRKKEFNHHGRIRTGRAGRADAVVSAGNSGATMASAVRKLGRLKGISRPGIASFFPTLKKPVMIMDLGANVDCRPQHLFQFAVMASSCSARCCIGQPPGRSAQYRRGGRQGQCPGQGNAMNSCCQQSLNFIGNVEGRDVYQGDVDVIVCDGFVGNISLKVSEGLAEAAMQMLRNEILKSLRAKIGYLLIRDAFKRFQKTGRLRRIRRRPSAWHQRHRHRLPWQIQCHGHQECHCGRGKHGGATRSTRHS